MRRSSSQGTLGRAEVNTVQLTSVGCAHIVRSTRSCDSTDIRLAITQVLWQHGVASGEGETAGCDESGDARGTYDLGPELHDLLLLCGFTVVICCFGQQQR